MALSKNMPVQRHLHVRNASMLEGAETESAVCRASMTFERPPLCRRPAPAKTLLLRDHYFLKIVSSFIEASYITQDSARAIYSPSRSVICQRHSNAQTIEHVLHQDLPCPYIARTCARLSTAGCDACHEQRWDHRIPVRSGRHG